VFGATATSGRLSRKTAAFGADRDLGKAWAGLGVLWVTAGTY
jgi:hypothetical protein